MQHLENTMTAVFPTLENVNVQASSNLDPLCSISCFISLYIGIKKIA